MNIPDGFSVFLRNLDARDVEFEVVSEDDPRHILHITTDISLYIRPSRDDLPEVIEGLRKLAATATEMADALSRFGDLDEPEADRVPWPTGLCGHPVPPGAWAVGFTICRDCIARPPEMLATFDEAAAPDLTVVDDEDGHQ